MLFQEVRKEIDEVDKDAEKKAQQHLDSLTKPKDSLGRLEDVCVKIAGIQGTDPRLKQKKIFVLAGDHGVTEEGVSAYSGSVTSSMVENFIRGGAAINALSDQAGACIEVVDMGVDGELELGSVVDRKIANGTNNFLETSAMTRDQARESVETGVELVDDFAKSHELIGLGDMGIGNTTSSAAIFCSLLDLEPEEVVGRGTGLNDRQLGNKEKVISESLEKREPLEDPIDVLKEYGGFEIGGLAGIILGAAAKNKVVVVDGYITLAAAVLAIQIEPNVEDYLIFSHSSGEKGFEKVVQELEIDPLLDLRMKLGEGTGAALAMNILEAAVRAYNEMATFEEAGIKD